MEENKHKSGYYAVKEIWHNPTEQLMEHTETPLRPRLSEAMRDYYEIVKAALDMKRETNVYENIRISVILFWCDVSGEHYPLDSKDIT